MDQREESLFQSNSVYIQRLGFQSAISYCILTDCVCVCVSPSVSLKAFSVKPCAHTPSFCNGNSFTAPNPLYHHSNGIQRADIGVSWGLALFSCLHTTQLFHPPNKAINTQGQTGIFSPKYGGLSLSARGIVEEVGLFFCVIIWALWNSLK